MTVWLVNGGLFLPPLLALMIFFRRGRQVPWAVLAAMVLLATGWLPAIAIVDHAPGITWSEDWLLPLFGGVCAAALWVALHVQVTRTGWRWRLVLHGLVVVAFALFWAVYGVLQILMRVQPTVLG